MIVVSDTTPLISLMKIGQLDLIHQLFGEVQIPNAVYEELVSNTRFPDECRQLDGILAKCCINSFWKKCLTELPCTQMEELVKEYGEPSFKIIYTP